MKQLFILFILIISVHSITAQSNTDSKYYVGASFGKSFSLGDFKDTDITNPDAGFANNGNNLNFFGGYLLNEYFTLTVNLRYQSFDTEIGSLVDDFEANNPNSNFIGSSGNWNIYYMLFGTAYKINIYKKFSLYPRVGFGPMLVNNPEITVNSTDSSLSQNFSRSSESGVGFGYEVGIGLKTSLGKHFALMPTFTFSGGVTRITDVQTITDNVKLNGNYDVSVQSFNLGLSLAYKFN